MPSAAKPAADYAAYLALRCVIAVIQALPMSVCERGAALLGDLFGGVLGFRRRLVDENLTLALPGAAPAERRRVARAMWRHLFLMVAEIAHAPRAVHRTTWRCHCRVPQMEPVVRTLLLDRPKVVISGHYSNFEFGGYMLGLFGFPSHTVARTLDNRFVDRFVNDFRGRTGQHMLPKQGSRDAIEELLSGGGTLTLLGDQAAGDKACWVNFFGKPASTHKAVALFTLGYEAPTMVTATRRIGGPLEFEVELADQVDPLAEGFALGSVPALTEWYTGQLERMILRAPEQYWWVHRRWKGTPPPRALKRLSRQAEATNAGQPDADA